MTNDGVTQADLLRVPWWKAVAVLMEPTSGKGRCFGEQGCVLVDSCILDAIGFTRLHSASPGFTRLHSGALSVTRMHLTSLSFT
jgi:hypothetical protein